MLLKIAWVSEYLVTILACFFAVTFHLSRPNKLWWARMVIGITLAVGIWLLRLIPGYLDALDVLVYFVIYFVLMFTVMFSFGLNAVRSLFIVAVTGTLQHSVYKLSLSIACLISADFRHTGWFLLVELAILGIGCALGYLTFGRKLKSNDFPINNILTFSIAGALAVATIIISFYTQEALFSSLGEQKIILSLVNFLSVLLCSAGLGLLYESMVAGSLKEENYILHMLSRKDKERYELAKATAESISIKYHDLKHAMAERTLDEEEKLELQKTETDYTSLMFSGNRALDLILIEKRRQGEEKGVHIQAIIDGSLMNFMKSYQIYSMFGNLLDNAIEACEKLPNQADKIVHLKISKIRDNVVVEETNKMVGQIEFVDGLPKTTKPHGRNHGYGVKSIKSVCSRYNGIMHLKAEDGVFVMKLVFPYIESEPNE